ncbi:nucleotide-diphospho-sugar transferase [Stereum hirsutum FP-91666 SS1]|uniref:nucleotide-diphospho-sugar transferase n=1 Tax=Stereum hirsutum (strain FP-91666) TaxID=721885 RepID=UPI000440CDA1|nr:nucleotide-diphospho-sugar transferase [Stereum hirsutum FP-91666 SS1]EIM89542.1 nucleotide-diphospho-sugar transferase [Stereum hirsutum FP-91666 SS1]
MSSEWNTTPAAADNPKAAIVMLVSPSRMTEMTMALYNIEDRFNRRLKYPYVLFTPYDEAYSITDEIKAKVAHITEGRATFAVIEQEYWDVPAFLDKKRVDSSLRNIGFSLGYRAMCRFYSGLFWRHPATSRYDWLWRLDSDIEFHCDVPYDPVERLISENALYGFVQVTYDANWVQESLASNVSFFLSQNKQLIPPDANLPFAWKGDSAVESALNGVADGGDSTGNTVYNNFEISHRSIWESELYTSFFEFLDLAGGFFYERWGDAPVHSYGLAMLLRREQAYQFHDLGYQHQGWEYECPNLDRCACLKEGAALDFRDDGAKWFDPQR